ncbi:MAG: hypothetical protein K2K92_06030 [Duncaniella sp.]|nr:hypothetical protein [Duncaniella sp.]
MRKLLQTFILLSVLATPAIAAAQAHVEKAVAQIQKNPNGTVSYKVQRDNNKNVINSSLYIAFTDLKMAKNLIDAMKRDADNAVEYSVNTQSSKDDVRSTNYSIVFDDGKGKRSSYSVMTSANGKSILKATVLNTPVRKQTSTVKSTTTTTKSGRTTTVRRQLKEIKPSEFTYIYNGEGSSSSPRSVLVESTTRWNNGSPTVTKRHEIWLNDPRSNKIVITTESEDGNDDEVVMRELEKLGHSLEANI